MKLTIEQKLSFTFTSLRYYFLQCIFEYYQRKKINIIVYVYVCVCMYFYYFNYDKGILRNWN